MIPPRPTKLGQRPAALAARRGRLGVLREPAPKGAASGPLLFFITNFAYVACGAIVAAHLLFAVEEHSFAVRLLTAIPAVVLLLESRHFLEKEAGELPFVAFALLQYYAAFGLGVFFELKFVDLRGPVNFSPNARLAGALAVALGALCISAAARAGRRVGRRIEPWAIKTMPPAQVPEQWDRVLEIYAGATLVVGAVFAVAPGAIPAGLGQPMGYVFASELALGFALAIPSRTRRWLLPQILLGFAAAVSLFRGVLEVAFRASIAYVTGRWAIARTVSLRVVGALLALYIVIQPVKGVYRAQVWTGRQVGVSERIDAWENALSSKDRGDTRESTMSRISELGAVMHAFDVLPGRVDFIDGEGFLPLFYSPIPRFIWPDKPTTQETVQRYGVTFGRQSEMGARTTAFNLPLPVEGYWNFGWAGVVLVTGALGFWLGLSQKLFAGQHWAMRATGVANLTNLTVAGPVVYLYGTIFQTITGRIIVCWGLFWLAQLLSRREQRRPQLTSRRALRS